MSAATETELLPPYPTIWEIGAQAIMLLAHPGDTPSAARYRGYKELDFLTGIGAFHPFDFKVSRVYLRRDWISGPSGECAHLYCQRSHPYATAYWRVQYLDVPKRYVDGVWRRVS